MKTKYLLPHSLKLPGWIILGIGLSYWIILNIFPNINLIANIPALYNSGFIQGNNGWFKIVPNEQITDELIALFVIIGSLFVALSKEKIEDELIMKIRLESLVWAVIVNSIFMIFSILAFYGMSFFIVLIFNAVSIQILFMIKFKLALRQGY